MFWSKGVGNRLTTSILSEQNHKLFRSILWSSFRNHKSVQNIMGGKSPSSSTPCHFVSSTLRSIPQIRPEYNAGKKPKQFHSMSLCRIYTP